jgi:hypothetical protein
MGYGHINFNPKKCRILVHNAEKIEIPPLWLPDAKGELEVVENCGIKDRVKYLGVPLSTRKLQKMKFNKYRVEKTMTILEKLIYSGLKVPQIIDAIRRFILPRLDYTMMNSVLGIMELDKLDRFIRNMINEMIGGPALSKDMFYTATKNGGLRLRLLTERYQACKYNTVAHFLQRDEGTREFIKWQFSDEKRKRSVKTKKGSLFFDWDEVGTKRCAGRSHSMISELYYAACRTRIRIDYDEKTELVAVWEDKEENNTKHCKKGETGQEVGKIFEARHYENLLKQKCRGRTFCTLGNSKV